MKSQTRGCIDTDIHLHANVPLFSFLRLVYLGIARLGAVLQRESRCDERGIDDAPLARHATGRLELRIDRAEEALREPMSLQQTSELEQRRCIRCRPDRQIHSDEASRRAAVVNGVFNPFIQQSDRILRNIHSRHSLEPNRCTPSLPTLRLVRYDQIKQCLPRHQAIDTHQKALSARHFLLRCESHIQEIDPLYSGEHHVAA